MYRLCVVHIYKDETFLVFIYKLNIVQTCNTEGQMYLLGIFYKKGSLIKIKNIAVNTVKMLILKAEKGDPFQLHINLTLKYKIKIWDLNSVHGKMSRYLPGKPC